MDTLIREGNPPAGQLASPVPQVWDPTANGGAGGWVRVYGAHNSLRAILYGPNGQPIGSSNPLPVADSALVQAVAQLATEGKLEEARALLETISQKDFATQTTLSEVLQRLEAIEEQLETGDAKVQLKGHSSPPTLVFINSDTVVPAGTWVTWELSSSERAEINRWPVFAIVLGWKFGSTNLNYSVACWQYLPNHENSSTTVPGSVHRIDQWSDNLSDRVFVARIRRFAMGRVILRIYNQSSYDQILSNFAVQCMIEGV